MDHQNQAKIPIWSTLQFMAQQYPELLPFSGEVYREVLRRQESTRQGIYLNNFMAVLPQHRGQFLDNFPVYPTEMDPYLRNFVRFDQVRKFEKYFYNIRKTFLIFSGMTL